MRILCLLKIKLNNDIHLLDSENIFEKIHDTTVLKELKIGSMVKMKIGLLKK